MTRVCFNIKSRVLYKLQAWGEVDIEKEGGDKKDETDCEVTRHMVYDRLWGVW